MPVDEETRHDVYQGFKQVHGAKRAAAIMQMLPPAGVPDLATKADLEKLEARLEARFEGIDQRFEGIDQRFDRIEDRLGRLETVLREQTDRYVRWMLTGLIAMTAVITMVFGVVTAVA